MHFKANLVDLIPKDLNTIYSVYYEPLIIGFIIVRLKHFNYIYERLPWKKTIKSDDFFQSAGMSVSLMMKY